MTAEYPLKVRKVLLAIERANANRGPLRPWEDVTVEAKETDHGRTWVIRAAKPGNVFVQETLVVFVWAKDAYVIDGTDIRMRASQRLGGGYLSRFGEHRDLKTWRDVRLAL